METRARFVLIGLFTLVGMVAMLGFVLWMAKVQLDRTYAQYDILFNTVSGLSQTAVVRYNGVDVGRVLTIALDRDDPALVRVRIEVLAGTPVRADTVATLASQGVTGVSYISLDGGSATAAELEPLPPYFVPEIRSERSVVQDLLITGPELLSDAAALIAEIRGLVTPENQQAITAILTDLQAASGRIDAVVTRSDATLTRVDAVLEAAQSGFAAANGLLTGEVPALLADLRKSAASATGAMNDLRGIAQADLPRLSDQISALVTDASRVIAAFDALARQISNDPGRFLLGTQTPEYRRPQ